ncbi:unnamed protein product, partial [Prorocentrum cordatum]
MAPDDPVMGPNDRATMVPGFREVPKTGVIYVMDQAAQAGYSAATASEWANLGQGSPETTSPTMWPTNVRKRLTELVEKGKISSEAGPWSLDSLEINEENLHYGSVNGDLALRRAVAKLYNDMYRRGKSSQYTAENVAIVGGGRLALTRLCCAMGDTNLGHFLPDYTAYAELLAQWKGINSIPILLDPENNFRITLRELKREIVGRGLSVLLMSNPCNPTGQLVEGEELKSWVKICRDTQCTLVLDEIYSRYIYTQRMAPTDAHWRMVSAAQFVEDVNSDPVVILDGLTKCWRMPGLRVCWIVAPRSVINSVGAAGSFLDGGASLPTQRSCVPLLSQKAVIEQTIMLQALFSHKRDFVLRRLQRLAAPVDFGLGEGRFEAAGGGGVLWQGSPLPPAALRACLERNVAYRVEADLPLGGGDAAGGGLRAAAATPLFNAGVDAGEQARPPGPAAAASVVPIKVAEPEEPAAETTPARMSPPPAPAAGLADCVGPVLWIDSMKMHISQGTADTRNFSRLLARASRPRPSERPGFWAGGRPWAALDVFHGLGVSTDDRGASAWGRLASWRSRKPEHADAKRFASLLPSPSVLSAPADDRRACVLLCDAVGPAACGRRPELFRLLAEEPSAKGPFDAAILDPPKSSAVMEVVYGRRFLARLAEHLLPNAVVSCYAPDWPPWNPEEGSRRKVMKAAALAAAARKPLPEVGAQVSRGGRVVRRPCQSWMRHFLPG